MRLKAEIWIKSYLRRCNSAGAFAVVARHGDDDAGAIFIRITSRDGSAALYGPAPAGMDEASQDRRWTLIAEELAGGEKIDARLASEIRIDADVWILEVEDTEGRHFLDEWIISAT